MKEPKQPPGNGAKIRQVELVGRKIRQLRKKRNFTQTELSSRVGIQQSDLSRMEKGEYRVSLATLFRILGEFNIGIGEFFDDVSRESLGPREIKLARGFQMLSAAAQDEVENLVRRHVAAEAEAGDNPPYHSP